MSRDLQRAQFLDSMGDSRGAMKLLADILTEDPDDADAHAVLGSILAGLGRPHGAEQEARAALAVDPQHPIGLLVLALVHLLRRELNMARKILADARAVQPEWAAPLVILARVESLAGRRRRAEACAREARALAPDDPEIPALQASLASDAGRPAEARRFALEALQLDPEADSAHGVMAQVELLDDKPRAAREHALAALRADPDDRRALWVLGGLKARGNLLLGLWWRYNRAMMRLGEERAMVLIVVLLVSVNLTRLVLDDTGNPGLSSALWWVFLAFVAYTWIGPGLYRRSLNKELEEAGIHEDY